MNSNSKPWLRVLRLRVTIQILMLVSWLHGPPFVAQAQSASGTLPNVQAGVGHGFYQQPFEVALRCPAEGVLIRYTTNGSPPTSALVSDYHAPVPISHTTVLCAAAFKTGFNSSKVATFTYLFLDDIILQNTASALAAGFPSNWNGLPKPLAREVSPDYGFDPRVIGQNGTDRYRGK